MLECGGTGESSLLPLRSLPPQTYAAPPLPACLLPASPSHVTAQLQVGSPKSSAGLLRQHLWRVRSLDWRSGMGLQPSWVVGVSLSLPPPCLSAQGDTFFRAGTASFYVSENMREGLGGNWRDITPSSVSQPVVCGPQVVCQISKGLQNDCRQFWGTDTSIFTHAGKAAKTTGSGSRRQRRVTCYNSTFHGEVQRCLLLFQRKKGQETPGWSSPAEMSGPHLCTSPRTL